MKRQVIALWLILLSCTTCFVDSAVMGTFRADPEVPVSTAKMLGMVLVPASFLGFLVGLALWTVANWHLVVPKAGDRRRGVPPAP